MREVHEISSGSGGPKVAKRAEHALPEVVPSMKHRPFRVVAALACGALVSAASSTALAYRPFDGTDAEVADFGELEIELGTAYTLTGGGPVVLQVPALVVNLGVYHRLELVYESNNELGKIDGASSPKDALSDSHLFLKAVLRKGFAQEQTGPSIALEAGPWLPNPNGEPGWGGSANLITSFVLHPLVFNVNLQGAYDLAHHPEIFGSVIMEGPRSLEVRPVTEIYAQHAFGGSTTYSALVGLIWKARKAADIDLAVEGLSTDHIPMARLRLGLTFRAGLWHVGG
jgi:hypothetical protein